MFQVGMLCVLELAGIRDGDVTLYFQNSFRCRQTVLPEPAPNVDKVWIWLHVRFASLR